MAITTSVVTPSRESAEIEQGSLHPPRSPWMLALRRLWRNRAATLGLAIILVLCLMGIFADLLTPYPPLKADFTSVRQPPSVKHLMGTDKQGRDILSRIMYGARYSITIGFISQALVMIVGMLLGSMAGYYGGKVDTVIMRITDIFYAFPNLLLLIILMAAFGRGFINLMAALALTAWVGPARLVRGQVLQLKNQGFVESARALGATDLRIILTHLLPNMFGPMIVSFSFGVPGAILAEAGLSFLGIGLVPPAPSWGIMLNDGFGIIRALPHVALFPGLVISLTMLAFLFLGDGVRDAFDPRTQR